MVRATSHILLILIGLLLLGPAAFAADLLVPSQYPTIQDGINAAVDNDVVLVADGTYTSTGNKNLDFGGKAITVRSQSGAPTGCIIDCQGDGRGFIFQNGETAASVLSGFTIQNGSFRGAGIYCLNSSPTISHCILKNNAADFGGGMYCANAGSLTVTDCAFLGNNVDADGGGVVIFSGSPIFAHCAFIGNNCGGQGGAVKCQTTNPTFVNCTFLGNTGASRFHGQAEGGAIYNYQSSTTVVNSTFLFNSADYNGGAIDNNECSTTVINSVFYGNTTPGLGGAILNEGISPTGSGPTEINCIFWGDSAGFKNISEIYESGASAIVSADHCLIHDSRFSSTPDANGNFNADPLFVRNPATNGPDDLGDLHLQPNSPAIGAGRNSAVTVPPFPADSNGQPLDLDGLPRLHGAVDLGVYEFNHSPLANAGTDQTVTIPHDGNPATNTASVTLDGTASSDPDADTLTYGWNDGQGHTATGATPILALPAGTYTFTLTVTDTGVLSSLDTVTIQVNPEPNQQPTANSQSVSLKQDTNLGITLTGSDPEGDNLTYQIAGNPAHGTLSGTAPNLTYTPKPGYFGTDSFTFTVTDPYGAVSKGTVSLTVTQVPKLKVTLVQMGRIGHIVGVLARVSNTSAVKATNVKIESGRLLGVNAFLVVPCNAVTLKPGQSEPVLLSFYPLNKGQKGTLSIHGSSSLGSFALDQTVAIP